MILTPDSSSYQGAPMQIPESTSGSYSDKNSNNVYVNNKNETNPTTNIDISSTTMQREPTLNLGNNTWNIYIIQVSS